MPFGDYAALAGAIRPETRLLLAETPGNPFLRVLDVDCTPEQRRPLGVADSLACLALGVEDAQDLIADLDQGRRTLYAV